MKFYFPELTLTPVRCASLWKEADSLMNEYDRTAESDPDASPAPIEVPAPAIPPDRSAALASMFTKTAQTKLRYAKTEINKVISRYGDLLIQTDQMTAIGDAYNSLSRWMFVARVKELVLADAASAAATTAGEEQVLLSSHRGMLRDLDNQAWSLMFAPDMATWQHSEAMEQPPLSSFTADQYLAVNALHRRTMNAQYVKPLMDFLDQKLMEVLIKRGVIPARLYALFLAMSSRWYSVIRVTDSRSEQRLYIRFNGLDKTEQLDDFLNELVDQFMEEYDRISSLLSPPALRVLFANLSTILSLFHPAPVIDCDNQVTLDGDPLTESPLTGLSDIVSGDELKMLLIQLRRFLTVQQEEAFKIHAFLVGKHQVEVVPSVVVPEEGKSRRPANTPASDQGIVVRENFSELIRLFGLARQYTPMFDGMSTTQLTRALADVMRMPDGEHYKVSTIRPLLGKMDAVLLDNLITLLKTLLKGAGYEIRGDISHRLNKGEENL